MDQQERERLLNLAIAAAREAGHIIRPYFRSAVESWEKSPDNPVTTADLAADRYLRETLTAATPDYGWLSEETVDDLSRLLARCAWVVDPLDGTQEFVRGVDQFAVSVALVVDGQAVLGAIHNPATDELLSAMRGQWPRLNDRPASPMSERANLAGARVLVSDTEVRNGMWRPYQDRLTLEQVGSAACKLARVAVGRGDAYVSLKPKHEWDICAGVALVEAAGGTVTDLQGRPIRFNQADVCVNGVVAAGPTLHPRLTELLAGGPPAAIECR